MTTVLLIRHANTDAVGRTLAGRGPGVHLNAAGKAQALELAERLASAPIKAVYSSPLERARETAAPLATRLGLPVQIREEIGEIDIGRLTGQELAALADDPAWKRFNTVRSLARFPGGEAMPEVQARMASAMEEFRRRHADEMIAVVSHAEPIRALLALFLGIPLDLIDRFEISPASISTVRLSECAPVVLGINHSASGFPA